MRGWGLINWIHFCQSYTKSTGQTQSAGKSCFKMSFQSEILFLEVRHARQSGKKGIWCWSLNLSEPGGNYQHLPWPSSPHLLRRQHFCWLSAWYKSWKSCRFQHSSSHPHTLPIPLLYTPFSSHPDRWGNCPAVGYLLKPVISQLLGLQSGAEGGNNRGTTENAATHSPVAVFTNQAVTVGAL